MSFRIHLYVWTVTRTDNGDATALSTLKTNYSDTHAIRLAYQYGSSIYEVHTTTSTLAPEAAGDVIGFISSFEGVCTLTAPGLTTPWTVVGSCTKAITNFQITLQNPACGGTSLAALQAIYGSSLILLGDNVSTCTSLYQVPVTSDNIACDTCDVQEYFFTPPAAYNGILWQEVDGTIYGTVAPEYKLVLPLYGTDCVCGVKFESAYVARQSYECFFDDVPYESDPLFIEISERNPDINDYTQLCIAPWPVTLVQEVKYPAGNGRFVAEFERLSRAYSNDPWNGDPAERWMKVYSFMTELDQYYDEYVLNFQEVSLDGNFARTKSQNYEWHFFFPETTGGQFQTAINSYIQSSVLQIPPVVI